jgi:hypothetical protein
MSALRLARRGLAGSLLLTWVLWLGGCAHPLTLSPNLTAISGTVEKKIDKRVGLLVTDTDRQVQVTTPGGGGDKVSYFPYRDLEPALYVALSESFASVARVASITDPKVAAERLDYIVKPSVQTTSFSDSVLTWPPTLFTIELVLSVNDSTGRLVTELRVMGEGRAGFDEFKSQPGLSANRAAEDAVKKLIQAIGSSPALRQQPLGGVAPG